MGSRLVLTGTAFDRVNVYGGSRLLTVIMVTQLSLCSPASRVSKMQGELGCCQAFDLTSGYGCSAADVSVPAEDVCSTWAY